MLLAKKFFCCITLSTLFLAFLLTGCSTEADGGCNAEELRSENITLTLLDSCGFYSDPERSRAYENLLTAMIRRFEETHENVTIKQIELPSNLELAEEESLETIMGGEVPDIFLLPTFGTEASRLFPDVNQAMRNGSFADLSSFYNADDSLGKASLNRAVMDAGVINGARYTLPLRYDFPVACVNLDKIDQQGIGKENFRNGVFSFMDAVIAGGDALTAAEAAVDLEKYILNFFPELVDYDTDSIRIQRGALTDFISKWVNICLVQDSTMTENVNSSYEGYYQQLSWLAQDRGFFICNDLGDILLETAFAKAEGTNMAIYPLTGEDGKVVAEVSYYGAVSSNCANVELAYQFLREFLMEDYQWEMLSSEHLKADRFCTAGYPVRSIGSVNPCYQLFKKRSENCDWSRYTDSNIREAIFDTFDLSDADIPVLNTPLDAVRFPMTALEYNLALNMQTALYNGDVEPNADGIDIEAVVDDFFFELTRHMTEN